MEVSSMEKQLWERIYEKFGKISFLKLSDLVGIDSQKLWKLKNFGRMYVADYERLLKLLEGE